jgi:hypothetical protein
MAMMRFRLLGSRADVDDVIARLHGLNDIEHVEELDGIMPEMRDDSSSSDSISDNEARTFLVEVEAPNDDAADRVRVTAETCARARDAGIEFLNDF